MEGFAGGGVGAAQRHIRRWAATLCILLRHSTNLVVAAVVFANPGAVVEPLGRWLLVAVGCWAVYRLATRSQWLAWTLADAAATIAVCAAQPWIIDNAHFVSTVSAPQVVTSAAVATFAIQLAPAMSLPVAVLILGSYGCSAATVVGWREVLHADDIYFFVVQAVTGILIRIMLWRIAAAVDRARASRLAAEVSERVGEARHDYDREQLAVLHDTAAATLLLVGQGAALPPGRLAAQARRDLDLLGQRPWSRSSDFTDLVALLRAGVQHLGIPVAFTGEKQLWIDGQLASAVAAAVREATNNVDRHAHATIVHIEVRPQRVTVTDDGVGFAHEAARRGHGTRESILGRMQRVGGSGVIRSSPTEGTVVELSWPEPRAESSTESVTDTDRFIRRVRVVYGLAITAFAVMSMAAATVPWSIANSRHPAIQGGLVAVAAACTLVAIPVILMRTRRIGWVAGLVLAGIALARPALVDPGLLTTDGNWSLGMIGWCVVPLLLGWPAVRAAAVLSAYWVVPAVIDLIRNPSGPMAVYLGLSLAGFLIPQLFTLSFGAIARRAAHDARAENEAQLAAVTKQRVAEALRADYLSRYAEVIDRVVPVLTALSRGERITPKLRRQAKIESSRLRMLFDHSRAPAHPVVAEIRSLAEAAEQRGVDVSIDLDADLPNLSSSEVREFATPIAELLAEAGRTARIVLTAEGAEVTGSVVCDVQAVATVEHLANYPNVTSFVCSGDSAWMTVVHAAVDESGRPATLMSTA
ncbi:MAG: ATP-binding protein [Mycobacteriaceae bacterium]|nr:ATP-binding protein [Mycobacteriaceae bacterium]